MSGPLVLVLAAAVLPVRQPVVFVGNKYGNYEHAWRDERTTTPRKNACNRETMMKIRVVIIFIIAQVVLAK